MSMLQRVNIEKKLKHCRNKNSDENTILAQVRAILDKDTLHSEQIQKSLSEEVTAHNQLQFHLLETENIFHIEQIKKICIDYRLRFLSTKYFKGTLPQEAITAIKNLEKQHNTGLKGFKIMAPSRLFKLENADDPLLFVTLGNDYYYLIHKWGKDLHPLRKLLVLPFKSFLNLGVFILLLSWLLAYLIPMELFTHEKDSSHFWLLFFFMFKMVASITIFYGVALGKNFNYAIWNSKYYNA